jgi:hypothetical protein
MEMPVETLELLQSTAQKAQKPETIEIPGENRIKHFALNGELKEIDVPPPNRKHTFRRLADLIDMANLYGNNDGHPAVWHDQNQVVLLIDDTDRRDTAVFPLDATAKLRKMMHLEKEQPMMTQKQLVRLLRVDFELEAAKVAIFRRIDWSSNTTGQGTVERGRESLGRTIEEQVKGAQEIPESIVIPIELYRNLGEDEVYNLRCLVDFDIQDSLIQIIPAPGEIDHALHLHQMNIRERLEKGLLVESEKDVSAIQIYFGTP